MRGRPSKLAVVRFPACVGALSFTTSPVIVNTPETDEEVVAGLNGANDPAPRVAACSALALESALESPAGEHPTKLGAVSLTASHSC